ncbi:MAG: hypothetical protein U0174_10880 [Polyangiaceae bacterium]
MRKWIPIACALLAACRCGSHEEPPRDPVDAAATAAHQAKADAALDAGSDATSHAALEDERPPPGAPRTPKFSVEEDEDSKEPSIQVHDLPAVSVDGKLLAIYLSDHAVVTTAEQSLVIIDIAKRAEVSKLVLVRQGEISELDEQNPTRRTPAILGRVQAANQLLAKSHWKTPIYKEGGEVDLADDEKQPPLDLGPLHLHVDEDTHKLVLERQEAGEAILLSKDVKGWSNNGKPISLSDLVLVPSSDTSGLLVLVSSEFDADPNPRRALRILPYGKAPSAPPAASSTAR